MMRALTIWQPWAWAITHSGKRIENRSWKPPRDLLGDRIAIHAGKTRDDAAVVWMRDELSIDPADRSQGSSRVVGVATVLGWASIVGCTVQYDAIMIHPDELGSWVDSPWFSGPVGWLLADVRALREPVPCRGAQGLWRLPPDVEAEVIRQIAVQP